MGLGADRVGPPRPGPGTVTSRPLSASSRSRRPRLPSRAATSPTSAVTGRGGPYSHVGDADQMCPENRGHDVHRHAVHTQRNRSIRVQRTPSVSMQANSASVLTSSGRRRSEGCATTDGKASDAPLHNSQQRLPTTDTDEPRLPKGRNGGAVCAHHLWQTVSHSSPFDEDPKALVCRPRMNSASRRRFYLIPVTDRASVRECW